ncbi:rhomboid family intramembrane serine protease [Terrimonas alba]|uniref:rhomboid family intramembrane serine protease n=1 Tax=Terrimonas alba TaxID=3349636 RepID=UPI0035F43A96
MSQFRFTRPSNFPPIVKNLIIINILVWIAQLMFHKDFDLTNKIALYPIDTPYFKPYQIATHMFAHATYDGFGNIMFFHILFNMFTLWMFGKILENVWGSKRFLFFYLSCGVGAALCHLLVQHLRFDPALVQQLETAYVNQDQQTYNALMPKVSGFFASAVGASGAVMGVMVGFAYLFPNTELYLMLIPIPVKAKWAILGLVLVDLFGGISPLQGDNIAHFAHLGGAITGFIIVYIWNKTNRKTLY